MAIAWFNVIPDERKSNSKVCRTLCFKKEKGGHQARI